MQREIAEYNDLENPTAVNISKELSSILEAYTSFCDKTSGKTAQYWMGYINLVNLYHEFSRSIRSGDLELYIYCLPNLAEFFFAFNHDNHGKWWTKYNENLISINITHPHLAEFFFTFNHDNYGKWWTKYHENLISIDITHAEVQSEFDNRCFPLKRTKKCFLSVSIDLELEQTRNVDTASQRTGISSITNSISAWKQWAESHSLRTRIISMLFEQLGITKKDDITRDLKSNHMKKNLAEHDQNYRTYWHNYEPFLWKFSKRTTI